MERRAKKQQRCQAHAVEGAGDRWDPTAVTADSTRGGSLVVGKRTDRQTRALVHDVRRRLRPGQVPALCTDASEGYAAAMCAAFGRRYPAPRYGSTGRPRRPVLRWPHGLA